MLTVFSTITPVYLPHFVRYSSLSCTQYDTVYFCNFNKRDEYSINLYELLAKFQLSCYFQCLVILDSCNIFSKFNGLLSV